MSEEHGTQGNVEEITTESNDQEEKRKKLNQQEEIFQLFFGSQEQLNQLSQIYEEAYAKNDLDTLEIFFPYRGRDINNYPKNVEVLKDGGVATVVDKNMPEKRKNKYREALRIWSNLKISNSNDLNKFINYANKKKVEVKHSIYRQVLSIRIGCDVDKLLGLLNEFEREQSKDSLSGKVQNAETRANNQNGNNNEREQNTQNESNR